MKLTDEINAALRGRFLADQTITQPGVYASIQNDEYHAGDGVSRSMLLAMEESPFDCYALNLDPERPQKNGKVRHGTLAHCAIFEPDQFLQRYAPVPTGDDIPKRPSISQRNATKPSPASIAAIEWWDNFTAANAGKEIIDAMQYETAMRQADSVRRHAQIQEILGAGRPEVSVYWRDAETGLLCRCRPDWERIVGDGAGAILPDGKTYATANPEAFVRQIERDSYHVQAAFYSDGYEAATGIPVVSFPFITVRDTYPYTCSINELDAESIEAGRAKYRRCLNAFAACLAAGEWPAFPDVNQVQISKWKINRDL